MYLLNNLKTNKMDFRTEIAKWGYNKGNSIDVDLLVNEILPSLFSQQERSYSEEEVYIMIGKAIKENGYKQLNFFDESYYNPILADWFEQFKKK